MSKQPELVMTLSRRALLERMILTPRAPTGLWLGHPQMLLSQAEPSFVLRDGPLLTYDQSRVRADVAVIIRDIGSGKVLIYKTTEKDKSPWISIGKVISVDDQLNAPKHGDDRTGHRLIEVLAHALNGVFTPWMTVAGIPLVVNASGSVIPLDQRTPGDPEMDIAVDVPGWKLTYDGLNYLNCGDRSGVPYLSNTSVDFVFTLWVKDHPKFEWSPECRWFGNQLDWEDLNTYITDERCEAMHTRHLAMVKVVRNQK